MEYHVKLEKHTWCSNNKLRSAQKWASHKLKKDYDGIYTPLIQSLKIPKFENRVEILVLYNSRLDPDNVTGKFFIDSLVSCGVIQDDSKKFVAEWRVRHCPSFKHNTYKVIIKEFIDGDQKEIDF